MTFSQSRNNGLQTNMWIDDLFTVKANQTCLLSFSPKPLEKEGILWLGLGAL